MKKYNRIVGLALVTMVMIACSKSDTESPVFTETSINGNTTDNHAEGITGTVNQFGFRVTDNEELVQVKVAISPGTGLHTHGEIINAFQYPVWGNWEDYIILDVDGKEHSNVFEFIPPDSVSGTYHVEFAAVDLEGNLTIVEKEVHLFNDLFPSISVESATPALNEEDEWIVPLNGTITLEGTVLDTDNLDSVFVQISRGSTDLMNDTLDLNQLSLELNTLTIPTFTTAGSHTFTIRAIDTQGYEQYVRAAFKVE